MSCTSPQRADRFAPFRLLSRSFVTVLALIALTAPTFAQQPATGTIRGKVQNASNGAFLENVVVQVTDTGKEVLTNSSGEFELRNVPAGEVTLRASYVGEPAQSATVTVAEGAAVTQDFTFRSSKLRDKDGVIQLDPYTVNVERYQNARAIAIAEERNSINIKNVIAIDQFGDIPSGNVGELVKFLPGVQVSYGAYNNNNQGYSDSDASGVSIRGFGPEDTAILIDGLPVANVALGGLTRQIGLDQLSINNASRVELVKVATPDMPNNSIGGQINLISRSAFELPKATYSARVFFNFNSQEPPEFSKSPGPVNKHTYKTTPGVEFSASVPLRSNLGISFSANAANEFNSSHRAESTYTTSGSSSIKNLAGNPQSLTNPALTRFKVTDIARLTEKRSSQLRLDWKPTPSQLLKANVSYSSYSAAEGQRRLDARPSIAVGQGLDWNDTATVGRIANSTMDMTVTTRDVEGDTKSGQLQYSFVRGDWSISASGSFSDAETQFEDRKNGHFSEVSFKLNPGQVNFLNVVNGIPGTIETFARPSNGGAPLDYTKFSNYTPDAVVAKSGETTSRKKVGLYKVDVERDLSSLGFVGSNSLSFKFGARRDQEKNEKSGLGSNYNQILIPGATFPIADVYDDTYLGISPGFGYPAQEWGSTYKLFEINEANNIFYVPDDGAEAVNNWNSFVGQQVHLTETRDAFYAQMSGTLFRDRLYFVGGLRQEAVTLKGRGPQRDPKWNYLKNPDGTLYRDTANPAGVRLDQSSSPLFTPAGASLRSSLTAAGIAYPNQVLGPRESSLESAMLFNRANAAIDSEQTGKPSYSLSTVYKLTPKIDLKLSWSRSFGLPPIENGTSGLVSSSGQFQINENLTIPADGTLGTITVANPNLKPQISNNWDGEISYYTDTGGKLSVSYYFKDVTDQIQSFSMYSGTPGYNEILTALGLEPASYDNWILKTSTNSLTNQRTSGWEFQASQDFGFLGSIGKRFSAFASLTLKSLAQPGEQAPVEIATPAGGTLTFVPSVSTIKLSANRFAGAGLQYSSRKLTVQIRGTYRNRNEIARSNLPDVDGERNYLRRFEPSQTNIDLTANYIISDHYSVFISGRDIFNGSRWQYHQDDLGLLPVYAQAFDRREFGAVWSFGVNGRW